MRHVKYTPEWWRERLPLIEAFAHSRQIQYSGNLNNTHGWLEFNDDISAYTIAPKTITVNGFKVPAPETVAPGRGITVYIPEVLGTSKVVCSWWTHGSDQERWLIRGLVYLNKDHAIARAKAMLGIDPAEDCK